MWTEGMAYLERDDSGEPLTTKRKLELLIEEAKKREAAVENSK